MDMEARTKAMMVEAEKIGVDRFTRWLEGHGGRMNPNFHYAQDVKMGLSIFTSSDMEPDIEAISVPKSCCITANLASRQILSFVGQSQKGATDIFTGKEWIVFYLFLHRLVSQFELGPDLTDEKDLDTQRKRARLDQPDLNSCLLHGPYVDLLPEEILTPLHYCIEELKLLQSTPLYGHAIESRRNGRKSCIKAVKWLLSHLQTKREASDEVTKLINVLQIPQSLDCKEESDDTTDLSKEVENWDFDEDVWSVVTIWRWAETAYGSRAFPPRLLGENATDKGSAPVLIPGLDSFNHARKAKVTWTWHTSPTEHITLTLHQALSKYDQVFNSYGPKSNEDLLASYGFVNEGMEDDTVTLKLGGTSLHGQVPKQHYWKYGQGCPSGLLEEVMAALRHSRDAQQTEEKESSDMAEQLMEEGEAMDTIVQLLEHKIHSFESAQKDIDANVDSSSVRNSVRDNVNIYRHGQIRILRLALLQSQKRMDDIEQQLEEN